MGIADWLQVAIEVLGLAGFGFGAANRWATANHRDQLAMLTSAGANAAGRIRLALSELPPGADLAMTRNTLTRTAASQVLEEFAQTAQRIGATPEKVQGMIAAHIAPPIPAVVP